MATLTPTLTLASTDYGSDTLNFTVTDSLTVTEPSVGISRLTVLHTAASQILADAGSDGTVYFYLKNIDTTNFVSIMNDAGNKLGKLNAQEFAFIPVDLNEGLELQANTASCVVEYAYFTKS